MGDRLTNRSSICFDYMSRTILLDLIRSIEERDDLCVSAGLVRGECCGTGAGGDFFIHRLFHRAAVIGDGGHVGETSSIGSVSSWTGPNCPE